MKSLYSFRLSNKLTSTGSSVTISNVRFWNTVATFTNESLVLTTDDGTTFEMCTGTAAAGTLTLLTRWLDNSDTKVPVVGNQKDWWSGTLVYVAALASDIFDKDAAGMQTESGWVTFSGNNTFSGTNTFSSTTNATLILQNVTTAQRLALTGVANWTIVYDTTLWLNMQYKAWVWATIDTGTATPAITESALGTAQEATQVQFDAGTKTGSVGDLMPTPDKIQKMIYTATPKTSMVAADLLGISDSAAGNINKSIRLDNLETQIKTDLAIQNQALVDSTYMMWEAVTAGQCVFLETWPTFAVASNKQNIGDVVGNTRVAFPVISTGVDTTTFKVSICKTSSPSVNLNFRLETDNAGSPSGTLFHANATATIAAASLTTSLADTTMTRAGAFTAPTIGTKCWLVVGQASDTVNGTNYYNIGYSTNDTTTRGLELWNTTWWAIATSKRCYISWAMIQNQLLSLTDSDFAYKVDLYWISTESKWIGAYPKLTLQGINTNQSGLTYETPYYLSWTPWAISSTAGTNKKTVWLGIADSKISVLYTNEQVWLWTLYTTFSLPTSRALSTGAYVKYKTATIICSWRYIVSLYVVWSGGSQAYWKIYKNWVAYWTERNANGTPATFTENLYFSKWDTCELRWYCASAGSLANFTWTYYVMSWSQFTAINTTD